MSVLAGYSRPTLQLPAPDPRTTLTWMRHLTLFGLEDVKLRLFAEELVAKLAPHDYLSEYAAVLNWVRTNIRYSRDPSVVEQLKTPQVVIETGTGDCDEMSIVIGTLVASLGARVRYVAGAFKRDGNGRPSLSHVWCEALDPNAQAWVVLDPVPGRNVAGMLTRLIDSTSIVVG